MLLELGVDAVELPAELLDVLRPLEVADRHAAGVGENVRDDQYILVSQDLVGLGSAGF